jgi:hypothetical protein
MEYLPVLEVGGKPFNRRAQGRDLGIVFLIGYGELSAFRLLLRGDQPGALVSLVAEPAAGFLDDLGGPGVGERFRVVGFPGKRVRDPDGRPVEKESGTKWGRLRDRVVQGHSIANLSRHRNE